MSATTDSLAKVKFDKENQPGISNLINIYSCNRFKYKKRNRR